MRETQIPSLGQEDPLEEEPAYKGLSAAGHSVPTPLWWLCFSEDLLFPPQRVSHRTHCVLRSLSAQNDWQVPRPYQRKLVCQFQDTLEDVLLLAVRHLKFLWRLTAKHTMKRKKKINLSHRKSSVFEHRFFHPVIYWINTYFRSYSIKHIILCLFIETEKHVGSDSYSKNVEWEQIFLSIKK